LKAIVYDEALIKATLADPNVTEDKLQGILDDRIYSMMQSDSITNEYSRMQLKKAQTYWVKQAAWEYG